MIVYKKLTFDDPLLEGDEIKNHFIPIWEKIVFDRQIKIGISLNQYKKLLYPHKEIIPGTQLRRPMEYKKGMRLISK